MVQNHSFTLTLDIHFYDNSNGVVEFEVITERLLNAILTDYELALAEIED